MAEKAIANLAPEANCVALQTKAVATFEAVMKKHRTAQLKFDEDEKKRFANARKTS